MVLLGVSAQPRRRFARAARTLAGLLGALLGALVLAGCGIAGVGQPTAPTACERAVDAAAAVPDSEVAAGDLDGAIAVCDGYDALVAALADRPGALADADVRSHVAERCAADPVLALSAVCSTLEPAPSVTAPAPSSQPTVAPGEPAAIVFGTGIDGGTVTGQTARFRRTYPQVAFGATLPAPIGADSVTVRVTRGAEPGGPVALTRTVDIADPAVRSFATQLDLTRLLDRKAGLYVMQVLVGDVVVAEGAFELVG